MYNCTQKHKGRKKDFKMRNGKSIKLISVICAILIFTLLCVLVFQLVRISTLKNREDELASTLAALEEQVDDYNAENEYMKSYEYLEDYAREVLGWGKENEVNFD